MHTSHWHQAKLVTGRETGDVGWLNAAEPIFSNLSPQDVSASNAWYGARGALRSSDAGLPLRLSAAFRREHRAGERLAAIHFTISGSPAQFIAPRALLTRIIADLDIDADSLRPQSQLLLLEHRLSGMLGAIENALDAAIVVQDVSPSDSPAPQGTVSIDASCEVDGEQYWLGLALPHFWVRRCADELKPVPPALPPVIDFPVGMAVRAGWAHLTIHELASLRLNDVVLVDTPLAPTEVLAAFGERYAARARWEGGKVVLLEPLFRLSNEQRRVWSMTGIANNASETELDGQLDDILIKLTFEMGRKEVELASLRTLAEGHVFELGRDPRTAVDILAGSRRIGQGELVRINETLGVRITRLFNHE
jgi:type III secretion protein Q